MKAPKRHHFIPQHVIKRFADGKSLFMLRRTATSFNVHPVQPKDAFVVGHYNSKENRDGTKDASFESELSKIENSVASLFDRFEASDTGTRDFSISTNEREALTTYTYYQHKRTPDFWNEYAGTLDGLYGEAGNMFELAMRIRFPENAASFEGVGLAGMKELVLQNARVSAMGHRDDSILTMIKGFGFDILKIPLEVKPTFILSSRGLAIVSSLITKNENRVIVPIGRKTALAFRGYRDPTLAIPMSDNALIRRINIALLHDSSAAVSGSEALLKSLASQR